MLEKRLSFSWMISAKKHPAEISVLFQGLSGPEVAEVKCAREPGDVDKATQNIKRYFTSGNSSGTLSVG